MMEASTEKTIKPDLTKCGQLARYIITAPLGDTHLYPVYLAKLQDSDETFVVKMMDVEDESFANECKIFDLPSHRHIIRLKERLIEVPVEIGSELAPANSLKATNLETPKNAIVMEFVENGDLFNYLVQGPLPEKIARYFFEQILEAVEHLHSNGFCHLDLKLENILLDKDFCIKLTDFGFAAQVEKDTPLYKRVGTPSCRPPEMWKIGTDYLGYDGCKADIFQLGNLLFTLVAGTPAFMEAHTNDFWFKPILADRWDVFWNFKERAGKTRKQGSKVYDPDFKQLISEILNANETKRPTIDAIRKSAWYTKGEPATALEVAEEMKKRKEQTR